MCDTRGGTSANFLHTAAPKNKFAVPPSRELDYADNPFDKLPMERRKPLRLADLSQSARAIRDMLTGVNKRVRTRGWNCVSPIHGHIDSNLKNLRF